MSSSTTILKRGSSAFLCSSIGTSLSQISYKTQARVRHPQLQTWHRENGHPHSPTTGQAHQIRHGAVDIPGDIYPGRPRNGPAGQDSPRVARHALEGRANVSAGDLHSRCEAARRHRGRTRLHSRSVLFSVAEIVAVVRITTSPCFPRPDYLFS